MSEVLVHRLLRECAFGPEEADLERLLLGETGGHDFAEEPQDFFVPEWPTLAPVALERLVQDFGLAFRPVEIDGVPVRVLGNTHLACKACALVDKRVQLGVDGIDALADRLERRRLGCRRGRAPSAGSGRRRRFALAAAPGHV